MTNEALSAILIILMLGTIIVLTAMALTAAVKMIYWYITAIRNEPVYDLPRKRR